MRNVICGRCVKCGREYEAVPNLTNCECGGILVHKLKQTETKRIGLSNDGEMILLKWEKLLFPDSQIGCHGGEGSGQRSDQRRSTASARSRRLGHELFGELIDTQSGQMIRQGIRHNNRSFHR